MRVRRRKERKQAPGMSSKVIDGCLAKLPAGGTL
jgi:hypothetical protein